MNLPARNAIILAIIFLFSLVSMSVSAPLDESKLDEQISIEFMSASMADAIHMISSAADIGIAGPAEPARGIVMVMRGETIRKVLDALAGASGTTWDVRNEIVIFRKRPEVFGAKPEPSKAPRSFSPDEGMAEMIATLSPAQFFRVTSGFTLAYAELTDYQKEILKSMLSAPTIGVRDTDEVIRALPASERANISFLTMPYLVVPDQDDRKTMNLRMDTTPYITLERPAQ